MKNKEEVKKQLEIEQSYLLPFYTIKKSTFQKHNINFADHCSSYMSLIIYQIHQKINNFPLSTNLQFNMIMDKITSDEYQQEPSTIFCSLLREEFVIPSGTTDSITQMLLLANNHLMLLSHHQIVLYNLLTSTITARCPIPHPLSHARTLPSTLCLLSPLTSQLLFFCIADLTPSARIPFTPLQTTPLQTITYDLITWADKSDVFCLTQKVYINTLACFYTQHGELIWKVELRGVGLKYDERGLVVSYSQRIQDKIQLELTSCEKGCQQTYSVMELPEREFLIVFVRGVAHHRMLIGANQQKVLGVEKASTWMELDLKTESTTILFKAKQSILNVLFIDTKKSLVCFTQPTLTGMGFCKEQLVLLNYNTKEIYKREHTSLYRQVSQYAFGCLLNYDTQIEQFPGELKVQIFKLVNRSSMYLHLLKRLGIEKKYGQVILPQVLSLL